MAKYAKIDENNIVTTIMVVQHIHLANELSEGTWVRLNGMNSRGTAGVGYTYDSQTKAFIPPKPYPSWSWNDPNLGWEAPVSKPITEGIIFDWNEELQIWEDREDVYARMQ